MMPEIEIRSFFENYASSFLKTEAEIAEFYNAPCITARQGVVRLNGSRQDIQAFFGEVLRRYREQGNTQGEMRQFDWVALGCNSIAATVTWAYKDAAGRVLWESTFTYNLFKGSEGWKILLQVQHDAA